MDKIDLDAIYDKFDKFEDNIWLDSKSQAKECMKEAIHQFAVALGDNIKLTVGPDPHPKGWPYLIVNQNPNRGEGEGYFTADKDCILEFEKLIV